MSQIDTGYSRVVVWKHEVLYTELYENTQYVNAQLYPKLYAKLYANVVCERNVVSEVV